MKYLRIGYAHYIDENNCHEYGIGSFNRRAAIDGMKDKAAELGCTTSQGEWYDGIFYYTLYLHFDISSYPSDWSGNDFLLSFNFRPCDPIEDGDPQIKSAKIVFELPCGCELGELDSHQTA